MSRLSVDRMFVCMCAAYICVYLTYMRVCAWVSGARGGLHFTSVQQADDDQSLYVSALIDNPYSRAEDAEEVKAFKQQQREAKVIHVADASEASLANVPQVKATPTDSTRPHSHSAGSQARPSQPTITVTVKRKSVEEPTVSEAKKAKGRSSLLEEDYSEDDD